MSAIAPKAMAVSINSPDTPAQNTTVRKVSVNPELGPRKAGNTPKKAVRVAITPASQPKIIQVIDAAFIVFPPSTIGDNESGLGFYDIDNYIIAYFD